MVQTDTKRSYVDCNTLDVIDFMVTLGRFELPTCGLGNRRSIHLSYRATDLQFISAV